MKRSSVLKTEPVRPDQDGAVLTAQAMEKILILNYWKDRELIGRYCMNTITGEYETYYIKTGIWRQTMLQTLCEYDATHYWYYDLDGNIPINSEADKKLIKELLPERFSAMKPLTRIKHKENDYNSNQRESKESRRLERIRNLMDKIPPLPEDFNEWIVKTASGDQDYAFYDKDSERWSCTACGKGGNAGKFKRQDGKKARHNDHITCPYCGKTIQAKTRTHAIQLKTNAAVMQNIDSDRSVVRHLDIRITWEGRGHKVEKSEAVRVFPLRNHKKLACDIYYNQSDRGFEWNYPWDNRGCFDIKNPVNRRMNEEYLYPEGIEAALEGTCYEAWKRTFRQLAEAGKKLEYNRLMSAQGDKSLVNVVEYLFKGRFNRLLQETTRKVSYWTCEYYGPLYKDGETIEEVFNLSDRQIINRIRECDGGENAVRWMRWAEETGKKIDQETLGWLTSENIEMRSLSFVENQMSPRQVMNYVKRQQAEGYAGKSARAVLEQWADYLDMCRQKKKDTTDEMVYRPRELKRRHNELVEEMRKERMLEQLKRDEKATEEMARKMAEKYPGAEKILEEIRDKYEYQNEEYMMIVPRSLLDIAIDGSALHHCTGWSERYYERIMQRETYICFLRRKAEPDIPYYTIEVEPGGTIRQHRSYLDEEPGVEEIRGFLREWQRKIKNRLTKEDHRLASVSVIKRQKNIDELKEKNNTRVLKCLEEDFMEAI
ncbi:PcfJ domain-containing protein [Enterocloster bolteae]|uniref:PcfJ domain-containing protein n=1 Tax=Enterocloster bolteae TaxID=208479 RepID=UPI0027B8F02F|nr:PcfJ domain-containing protein [Enterocloster bolteae]